MVDVMRWRVGLIALAVMASLCPTEPTIAESPTTGPLFSASSAQSFFGKPYCQINFGGFASGDSANLSLSYSIEERFKKPNLYLFLLKNSSPTDECGTVQAFLDLTGIRKRDEYVYFKCHVGRRPYPKYVRVFGLGSNNLGHWSFIRPRLAWRMSVQTERFVPISARHIVCDMRAEER